MIPLLLLPLLALATGAAQPVANPPTADAEGLREGERLRADLLAQRPAENSSITGTLKIRGAGGERREVPVSLGTELVDQTRWRAVYETVPSPGQAGTKLVVTRQTGGHNRYELFAAHAGDGRLLDERSRFESFAGSDFSPADLGLEFLHWPAQQVIKSEMRRGRPCKVLASVNPQPGGGAYARVLSWIDNETGGLLRAEAYGADQKLVKEFSLRSFKKVNGQWQLREMEIISYPADSRTRLEFELNLDAKPPGVP